MTPSCVHISTTSSLFVCLFYFFNIKSSFQKLILFPLFCRFPKKANRWDLIAGVFLSIFHERKISVCGWVIHTAVVGTHRFPEEGNGPGLLLCFTVRTSESEPNIRPPTPPPCAHMHRMRDKGVPFLRTAHHRLSLWAEQWPFTVGASIGRGSNPYSPEVKTEAGTCSTSSWVHLRSLAVMLQTGLPPVPESRSVAFFLTWCLPSSESPLCSDAAEKRTISLNIRPHQTSSTEIWLV